jgi:two-component system, sensor histidine kinase PdtaS
VYFSFPHIFCKKILFFLFIVFNFIGAHVLANNTIDSLQQKIASTTSDTLKARLQGNLAWVVKFSSPIESVGLAQQELQVGYSKNNYLLLADAYRCLGLQLVVQKKYAQGIAYYDSCIKYASLADSKIYQASCYNLWAGIYGVFGDYEKCIAIYQKGLGLAEQSKDVKTIGVLSNNLATAYKNAGLQKDKITGMFLKSKASFIALNDWANAASIAANIASEYADNGQKELCFKEIKNTLFLLVKDSSDALIKGEIYKSIAYAYKQCNNLSQALVFANRAKHTLELLHVPDNLMGVYAELSEIYLQQKNLDSAQKYAEYQLKFAQQQGSKLGQSAAYKTLATIAQQSNHAAEAITYLLLHEAWSDSVFNTQREEALQQQALKEAVIQQEIEAKVKNKNLIEKNQSLTNKIIASILATLLFVVIAVYSALANRKNKLLNQQLLHEKKIVQEQTAEKAILVSELHHRVKNNLTMLKSLFYLQSKTATSLETKIILKESQSRIHSMALVHQQLYANDNTQLNITIFLQEMLEELCSSYRQNDIGIQVTGHCKDLPLEKALPLALIVNELATNSLKYAFVNNVKGNIIINIQEVHNVLQVAYTDNGVMDESIDLQKGGFGFKVIRLLCKQIKATITLNHSNSLFEVRVAL